MWTICPSVRTAKFLKKVFCSRTAAAAAESEHDERPKRRQISESTNTEAGEETSNHTRFTWKLPKYRGLNTQTLWSPTSVPQRREGGSDGPRSTSQIWSSSSVPVGPALLFRLFFLFYFFPPDGVSDSCTNAREDARFG